MKKNYFAVACALVAALAMPAVAMAEPSPEGYTVTDENGITMTVQAGSGSIATVEATETEASNVELQGEEIVLASFEVTGDATDLDITFFVGTKYAGAKARVFVEHNDGSTEVIPATVAADGTITIHVDGLSIFTVVVDPTTATGAAGGTDSGSKSPQTGVVDSIAPMVTLVASSAAVLCGGAIVSKARKN